MSEFNQSLVDKLLSAEPMDALRLSAVRRQIVNVTRETISRRNRILLCAAGVLAIAVGAGIVVTKLMRGHSFRRILTGDFGIAGAATLSMLVIGVFLIVVGGQGVFHRRRHATWLFAIVM